MAKQLHRRIAQISRKARPNEACGFVVDGKAVEDAVAKAVKAKGRLDGVLNAAGIGSAMPTVYGTSVSTDFKWYRSHKSTNDAS